MAHVDDIGKNKNNQLTPDELLKFNEFTKPLRDRIEDLESRLQLQVKVNGQIMKKLEKQNLSIPEPAPIPNNRRSIHDLVIEDLENFFIDSYLVKDVKDRKQFGLDKYGTILQSGNGRNALKDAFQESLDAIVYIKQEMLESGENDDLDQAYYFACCLGISIKKLIESKPAQEPSYSVLGDK